MMICYRFSFCDTIAAMKKDPRKKITLEEVAEMTARGFGNASKELNEVKGELKKDIKEIDHRLMTIEALLASNRIERLEDRMRVVLTHLKLDNKF
jgi:hypothetical protein